MSTSQDPARGGLIDHIHARIREEIMHQRLRPGVKLAAEHLATMLDVSRTPVRQALERLAQEGLVTRVPARGFFVAEIAVAEVRDLYDVRRALELHACDTAFTRGISPEALAGLIAADDLYRRLAQEDAAINRAKADQNFHLALAALGGNSVLIKMLGDIFERLNFRRRYDGYWYWAARGSRSSEAVVEHRALLAAIAAADRAAAVAELDAHLNRAWTNYERFLKTSAEMNSP